MITRRAVVLAAGCVTVIGRTAVFAQSVTPVRRIGILEVAPPASGLPRRAAFRQGLAQLGWIEGRNIELRFVSADGQEDRLEALAAAVISEGMAVIVTSSAVSTRALQKATRTVPIVMVTVSNPVANGFAASLARPGGNITGRSNQAEDVLPKLVEFLHLLAPQARRFGFLLNENNPSYEAYRQAVRTACAGLGLSATLVSASTAARLPGAVAQFKAEQVQGVVVAADPFYTSQATTLQQLFQPTGLPVAYGLRDHVLLGGLLCYGVNFEDSWRSAAIFVDRILKGEKPADMPIEQPTRFELVINLKTATALGLTVPQTLLLRADEVVR